MTKEERELFLLLISVSGIGGNTARTMLSSFSVPELATIILDGNEKMLKTVIAQSQDSTAHHSRAPRQSSFHWSGNCNSLIRSIHSCRHHAQRSVQRGCRCPEDVKLPAPAAKVVKAILKDAPATPVEKVIKKALQML